MKKSILLNELVGSNIKLHLVDKTLKGTLCKFYFGENEFGKFYQFAIKTKNGNFRYFACCDVIGWEL